MEPLLLPEKSQTIILLERKPALTLEEALILVESQPPARFIWGGIKEGSTGLIFGPSKSGKSIFAENLAFSLCVGRRSFLGKTLPGEPLKVLYISFEEKLNERVNRNKTQLVNLSEEEKRLFKANYRFQGLHCPTYIKEKKHWQQIKNSIIASGARVVVLDSITRLNPGKLEESRDAESIMRSLRDLASELGVTVIAIHHTPKIGDNEITMDSIKGSSVFSQESDFAIAVRATSRKNRYIKEVFYRYAPDGDDTVTEVLLTDDLWLEAEGQTEETEILNRTDRRRATDKREAMLKFFADQADRSFSLQELKSSLAQEIGIQERQLRYYLKEFVKDGKLKQPKKGEYQFQAPINPISGTHEE